METFYSILSAVIRPEIQEKITIGLALVNEERLVVGFSKPKINVLRELVSSDVFQTLRMNIQAIQQDSLGGEKQKRVNDYLMWGATTEHPIFHEQYLKYLSNYRQNILSFSAPALIDMEVNQATFNRLFELFIHTPNFEAQKGKERKEFIEIKKKPSIKAHFAIDYYLDASHIPNLPAPIKIDLAGKNDLEVYVMGIDLERRIDYVSKDVYAFYYLNRVTPNAKRFLVSAEPSPSFPMQFQTWQDLRKSSEFEYLDISEVEKIEEYALEHSVKPILTTSNV
jgi:hypothetical protein